LRQKNANCLCGVNGKLTMAINILMTINFFAGVLAGAGITLFIFIGLFYYFILRHDL
jgi:hypothetical protein